MLKAVIFDLGGTIVDKYSLTPILSFKRVFDNHRLICNHRDIVRDMGKEKREHIWEMLNTDTNKGRLYFRTQRKPDQEYVDTMFRDFNQVQSEMTRDHLTVLPETQNIFDGLRKLGIKIGITSGFNREIMNDIRHTLYYEGLYADEWISSTCLGHPGRPAPYMIQELMRRFEIHDPSTVLKVDDTNIGIQEGKNAGCQTIGVAKWSVNMGVESFDEILEIERCADLYHARLSSSMYQLGLSEPTAVVESLDDVLDHVNLTETSTTHSTNNIPP